MRQFLDWGALRNYCNEKMCRQTFQNSELVISSPAGYTVMCFANIIILLKNIARTYCVLFEIVL